MDARNGRGAEVECAQMTDERISGATRRQAREDSPAVSLLIEKYGPLRDDIRTLLNEIDQLPEEVRSEADVRVDLRRYDGYTRRKRHGGIEADRRFTPEWSDHDVAGVKDSRQLGRCQCDVELLNGIERLLA